MNNQDTTKLFVNHVLISIVLGISLSFTLLSVLMVLSAYLPMQYGGGMFGDIIGFFLFFIAGGVAYGLFTLLQSNINKILLTPQFLNKPSKKIYLYATTTITFLFFSLPYLKDILSAYHLL